MHLMGNRALKLMSQTKPNTTKSSESDVPKKKTCKLFHLFEVGREIVILATETV